MLLLRRGIFRRHPGVEGAGGGNGGGGQRCRANGAVPGLRHVLGLRVLRHARSLSRQGGIGAFTAGYFWPSGREGVYRCTYPERTALLALEATRLCGALCEGKRTTCIPQGILGSLVAAAFTAETRTSLVGVATYPERVALRASVATRFFGAVRSLSTMASFGGSLGTCLNVA